MTFLNIFFLFLVFSYNSFNHCTDVDAKKEYSEHLEKIKNEIDFSIDEFIKNKFSILREKYSLGAIKTKCKDYCLEQYHLLSPDDLKLISEHALSIIEVDINCAEEAYVMIDDSIQEFIEIFHLIDCRDFPDVKIISECIKFVGKCLDEKMIENMDRFQVYMNNESRLQILEALR